MNIEYKTGFEWCIDANVRVLNLNEWSFDEDSSKEKHYYETLITREAFIEALTKCKVKPNSKPRKSENYLEYRMYGLVPYNISPIQQAIQYGHAVVEYSLNVKGLPIEETKYEKWARKDKTFIILNGGTTNSTPGRIGTLNKHLNFLEKNEIITSEFYEPDLGDQLTAITFLVDERVWNKDYYEDFIPEKLPYKKGGYSKKVEIQLEERNESNYQKWVEKIGGYKNVILRDFLKQFRLA